MNKRIFIPLLCAFCLPMGHSLAQTPKKQKIGDISEVKSLNEEKRGASRVLQYYPDGEDFVCINGKNRYTRALYGGYTLFRLETSDWPVFATYDKSNSQNISFRVSVPGRAVAALDSVAYCESRYSGGKRSYRLTDPAWDKGELRITALALYDTEGAIWKLDATNMPQGTSVIVRQAKVKAKSFHRDGDLGTDPIDSFDAAPNAENVREQKEEIGGGKATCYFVFKDIAIGKPEFKEGEKLFTATEQQRFELTSRIRFETPDPYFNTLGGALVAAADGNWDGGSWLHGAIGWRMQLTGWRAGYIGDALGWHDRARTHFDGFAESQVTNVPNTIPHPAQDSVLFLARSEKKWGTPQYSTGYIGRSPHRNDIMHHYDMNLCYIDELLWHFNWTGDLAYVRKMWPILTRHLAWEKLNYDPDNDGLYDAYICIWASDALQYNSGAVTHSSAYNYRGNLMAARIAQLIGEDPTPYQAEADKILKAMNARLWLKDKGHWAEYQDFMGHKRVHESAALWTIYHSIDSDVTDPFQAYQATRYVDTQIPHIPVKGKGLKDEGYTALSTTNWFPYSWSINNVAFAEMMHTALSFFQSGRNEAAYKLLKSSILDGMYLGDSPGNFGQTSFYDAARGECYRDFGDPIGVASRVFIQGLYGILPDALNGKLTIRPGFPMEWDKASLHTPAITYSFLRKGMKDTYTVKQQFAKPLALSLQVNAWKDKIHAVTVNGKPATWKPAEAASGYPAITIDASSVAEAVIEIVWEGASLATITPSMEKASSSSGKHFFVGNRLAATTSAEVIKLYDPQSILFAPKVDKQSIEGTLADKPGHHTFFVYLKQGEMQWWQPVNIEIKSKEQPIQSAFTNVVSAKCEPVPMDTYFNASVTDIFQNDYLSPRSPYTTLQIPKHGIGEWCRPNLTADIDDSGMRAQVRNGLLATNLDISFRTPAQGRNIAFTSLWDNYPNDLRVPLTGRASRAYLLMAGSTNHMQCHIDNGVIQVHYTDGTCDTLPLVNPTNWCPIEQDYFVDPYAFQLSTPRPYRLHLMSGLVSNNLEKDLNITGVYGREIKGGAGVLLDMPLNPSKTLSHLTLETLSNDVVIGLMGVTLQR